MDFGCGRRLRKPAGGSVNATCAIIEGRIGPMLSLGSSNSSNSHIPIIFVSLGNLDYLALSILSSMFCTFLF